MGQKNMSELTTRDTPCTVTMATCSVTQNGYCLTTTCSTQPMLKFEEERKPQKTEVICQLWMRTNFLAKADVICARHERDSTVSGPCTEFAVFSARVLASVESRILRGQLGTSHNPVPANRVLCTRGRGTLPALAPGSTLIAAKLRVLDMVQGRSHRRTSLETTFYGALGRHHCSGHCRLPRYARRGRENTARLAVYKKQPGHRTRPGSKQSKDTVVPLSRIPRFQRSNRAALLRKMMTIQGAEEAWQQTVGGWEGPNVTTPTVSDLEQPSSASQDEHSHDMDFSASPEEPTHCTAAPRAAFTVNRSTRLRSLKDTLHSKGAWQQVTRIEDLCHTQVSHKWP